MAYTPSTDEVRDWYKSGAWLRTDRAVNRIDQRVYGPIFYAEFDRWLAVEEARIRADERRRIAEAIRTMVSGHGTHADSTYLHAARIAEGS